MKKIFINRISILTVLFLSLAVAFVACKKDTDGSPESTPGDPVLTAVSPSEASGGAVVTITGTGLGDMRTIIFSTNNVPALFSPNLNTDGSILFRIPDTAYGGNQNIVLTNSQGKTLTVPFKVIALPIITTAFPTDFQEGSTIKITGNNLDDVVSVTIDGTSDAATIVSKSRKTLEITMPASAADNGKLKITNASGSSVTTQVFVNVDKALQVYTDALKNGFESWSWGGTFENSSEFSITGGTSMKAAYDPGGTWGGLQLGNGGSINISGYRYFTFWVKGCDVDKQFQFWINWGNQKQLTIPANVWTYYKYDLITEYPGVTDVNNVTFQIYNEGKTVYFDNIMFIK